jgi:predicted NBD/HSP70 family sugar kinase
VTAPLAANARASTRPVASTDVRRHNLSLVLKLLRDHGAQSRADLAVATGMTKATTSSLVGDLISRGLVCEVGMSAGQRLGRPATLVDIDGSSIVAIGVELNVGSMSMVVTDVAGRVLVDRRAAWGKRATAPAGVLAKVVTEIQTTIDALDAHQIAGVTVAVPGLVDVDRGIIRVAPNFGWRDIPILDVLREGLGEDIHLMLDNEANLGALAEYRRGASTGVDDLVYVLAESGVGGGVVMEGKLFRGSSGYAGEIGHMTIKYDGITCGCGSRGCWETVIGLSAVLRSAVPDVAEELIVDGRLSPEDKIAIVTERLVRHDPIALAAMEEIGEWMGLGFANLADIFNPEVIVVAGVPASLAPWTLAIAQESMVDHAVAPNAGGCRLEVSSFGFSAGALGGALLAAERVVDDPLLVAVWR